MSYLVGSQLKIHHSQSPIHHYSDPLDDLPSRQQDPFSVFRFMFSVPNGRSPGKAAGPNLIRFAETYIRLLCPYNFLVPATCNLPPGHIPNPKSKI
jgi:hypothetical protein